MESHATSVAAAKSQPGTPSTPRLVIRIKIGPEVLSGASVRGRLSRGALGLILGVVAVLLTWVGIGMFRADPTPAPAAETVQTRTAQVEPRSADAKSVESEVREQPAALTSPTYEAIPDVPRSARQTIRGTIRVIVRVIVGADGTVLGATADDPGPSRYFERLAIEAARKWTFTRVDAEAQRIVVVTFNFTRAGTTARAHLLQ